MGASPERLAADAEDRRAQAGLFARWANGANNHQKLCNVKRMPEELRDIKERYVLSVQVNAFVDYEKGAGPESDADAVLVASRFRARYGQRLLRETSANEVDGEIISATTGSAKFEDVFDVYFDLPENWRKWQKFFEELSEIAEDWAAADLRRQEKGLRSVQATVKITTSSRPPSTLGGGKQRVASSDGSGGIVVLEPDVVSVEKPNYMPRLLAALVVSFVAGAGAVLAVLNLLPEREREVSARLDRLESILMARAEPQPVPTSVSLNCAPRTRVVSRPAQTVNQSAPPQAQ